VELSGMDAEIQGPQLDLLALSDALDKLAAEYPRVAELVKLRFFAGLTNEQAAKTLGISASTAKTDWGYAKCWLRAEMAEHPPTGWES